MGLTICMKITMSIQLKIRLFVEHIPRIRYLYDIDVDKRLYWKDQCLRRSAVFNWRYNKYLEYPLRVIDIQLSAPFRSRGKVSVSEDAVSLRPLDISNMPENESNSYPYTFQYNLSNSLSEDDEIFPIPSKIVTLSSSHFMIFQLKTRFGMSITTRFTCKN